MFPTKILLATNGSAEASVAEEAAVELANGTGSELHVVLVVSKSQYPPVMTKQQTEALLDRRRLEGLRLLEARVRRVEQELGGAVAASHYREGKPETETVRLGEEIEAGLIVTGGYRRPWYERMFCGAGFSDRVSRRAGRPVLVASESTSRHKAARP